MGSGATEGVMKCEHEGCEEEANVYCGHEYNDGNCDPCDGTGKVPR